MQWNLSERDVYEAEYIVSNEDLRNLQRSLRLFHNRDVCCSIANRIQFCYSYKNNCQHINDLKKSCLVRCSSSFPAFSCRISAARWALNLSLIYYRELSWLRWLMLKVYPNWGNTVLNYKPPATVNSRKWNAPNFPKIGLFLGELY